MISPNYVVSAVATLALLLAATVSGELVPADPSQVNGWFSNAVKPLTGRKSRVYGSVITAEAGVRVVTVRKDGSGHFRTVTDTVNSVPSGNANRTVVSIGGGVCEEKIKVDSGKPFVRFQGSAGDTPTLVFDGTEAEFGLWDCATLIVEADYFVAVNVIFQNSGPRPDGKRVRAQATALRVSGDKAAFYNCRMIGFQDSLFDAMGRHFFQDCGIEGTYDFIFGNGKSLYLNSELHAVGKRGNMVVTAQARNSEKEDTGYSFVHCTVNVDEPNGTYLGRTWTSAPRVVYAHTTLTNAVNPLGWYPHAHSLQQVPIPSRDLV